MAEGSDEEVTTGPDAREGGGRATSDPVDGEEGVAGRRPTPPTRNRVRNSMVWGLVATMSFGVLHQAYLLLGGEFVGFAPVIAVALGVGVVVAMSSYLLMDRFATANEQD